MLDFNAVTMNAVASSSERNIIDGKDPLTAVLLSGLLGWTGAHRFYLGTEILTGLLYPLITIVSCGSSALLGVMIPCWSVAYILPLVDFIILLIDYDDISKYIDNPSFFMWK